MGIKFNCPNGHKLNVKAFLAGKKGFCPQCGARVSIPAEELEQAVSPSTSSSNTTSLNATSLNVTALKPSVAVPSRSSPSTQTPVAVPNPQAIPAPAVAVPAGIVPAAAAPADPIADAPQAAWYVRPVSGGQFGPAAGDIMRKWIVEGRVSAESMIWREGWSDWKVAGPIFPGLLGGPGVPPQSPGPAAGEFGMGGAIGIQTSPARGGSSSRSNAPGRRRKSGSGLIIGVVVLLIMAVIGLLPLLIWVAFRKSG